MVLAMNNRRPVFVRAACLCAALAFASAPGAQTPGPPAATPAAPGTPNPPAETSTESPGYLFGLTFAEQLHGVGISGQVDQNEIARGIKDGLQGKKSTRAEQQQIQTFVRTVMADALAHNEQAAKDFLEKNGHEKGVKTTADGLQYKVLKTGDAKAADVHPTDEVTVQYRGKLIDGSEFDSSYGRGTPANFRVNGVIKGWQEALVMMKPGSKWELFVPPELAYGNSPRPGIPAGSLLIFEVELVSAKPAEPPPAAAAPPGSPNSNPATATPGRTVGAAQPGPSSH
jgi:FKBP-type peptidyl-prolyl cis-trans isomerase